MISKKELTDLSKISQLFFYPSAPPAGSEWDAPGGVFEVEGITNAGIDAILSGD